MESVEKLKILSEKCTELKKSLVDYFRNFKPLETTNEQNNERNQFIKSVDLSNIWNPATDEFKTYKSILNDEFFFLKYSIITDKSPVIESDPINLKPEEQYHASKTNQLFKMFRTKDYSCINPQDFDKQLVEDIINTKKVEIRIKLNAEQEFQDQIKKIVEYFIFIFHLKHYFINERVFVRHDVVELATKMLCGNGNFDFWLNMMLFLTIEYNKYVHYFIIIRENGAFFEKIPNFDTKKLELLLNVRENMLFIEKHLLSDEFKPNRNEKLYDDITNNDFALNSSKIYRFNDLYSCISKRNEERFKILCEKTKKFNDNPLHKARNKKFIPKPADMCVEHYTQTRNLGNFTQFNDEIPLQENELLVYKYAAVNRISPMLYHANEYTNTNFGNEIIQTNPMKAYKMQKFTRSYKELRKKKSLALGITQDDFDIIFDKIFEEFENDHKLNRSLETNYYLDSVTLNQKLLFIFCRIPSKLNDNVKCLMVRNGRYVLTDEKLKKFIDEYRSKLINSKLVLKNEEEQKILENLLSKDYQENRMLISFQKNEISKLILSMKTKYKEKILKSEVLDSGMQKDGLFDFETVDNEKLQQFFENLSPEIEEFRKIEEINLKIQELLEKNGQIVAKIDETKKNVYCSASDKKSSIYENISFGKKVRKTAIGGYNNHFLVFIKILNKNPQIPNNIVIFDHGNPLQKFEYLKFSINNPDFIENEAEYEKEFQNLLHFIETKVKFHTFSKIFQNLNEISPIDTSNSTNLQQILQDPEQNKAFNLEIWLNSVLSFKAKHMQQKVDAFRFHLIQNDIYLSEDPTPIPGLLKEFMDKNRYIYYEHTIGEAVNWSMIKFCPAAALMVFLFVHYHCSCNKQGVYNEDLLNFNSFFNVFKKSRVFSEMFGNSDHNCVSVGRVIQNFTYLKYYTTRFIFNDDYFKTIRKSFKFEENHEKRKKFERIIEKFNYYFNFQINGRIKDHYKGAANDNFEGYPKLKDAIKDYTNYLL